MKFRKLTAILLVTAMALSTAACGSSSSSSSSSDDTEEETTEAEETEEAAEETEEAEEEETASESTGEEIVLTIPTYYTGENVGAVYFEPAVERFNEMYEGVYRVEIEEVVEDTYNEKISQLAQAGQIPVLISGATTEFMETVLIPNELYYPMNDFLEEHPEIYELCLESSIEYCTLDNGDIVGVPIVTVSNMGLFYNSALYSPDKDIVDMTVDEFVESLGDNVLAFQTVDNAWTSMLFLSALIANEEGGVELLQEYDGSKLYDFNQDCIINAVQKLADIWAEYASASSVGSAYADAANTFMSNGAAIIFNGTWMNSEFKEDSADYWSNGFDGADVVADYYPGNIALASTKGYGRWLVTTGGTDEEREVALAFLAFIYSQDELEEFALTEGCQIPNLEYSDEFLAELEADPLILEETEKITADTTIVPTIASIMVDSVANDIFANDLIQLVNGVMTAEEFCADLTTKSLEAVDE